MTQFFLRALSRAGRTINNPFAMGGVYVLPKQGDAGRDFTKVVGDMRLVGNDMKKVAGKALAQDGK